MYENNLLAIFFALLSALTIAWGTVIRHRVAENTAEGDVPIMAALRSKWWWAGLAGAMAGYGLQIVALRFGTLLIVQPILVLSLMFTLPLASLMDGRRISKAETTWAAFLTVAVSVLVVLGRPTSATAHPSATTWIIAFLVGVVLIAPVYVLARGCSRPVRALFLGGVTGAIMGYLALMSKAVVDVYAHSGPGGAATSWEIYALLALAGVGTAVQQASFNAGDLKNSLPAMTILEPIVAFALGYIVLGEHFRVASSAGWAIMGAAFTVMVGATFALSRMGAQMNEVPGDRMPNEEEVNNSDHQHEIRGSGQRPHHGW